MHQRCILFSILFFLFSFSIENIVFWMNLVILYSNFLKNCKAQNCVELSVVDLIFFFIKRRRSLPKTSRAASKSKSTLWGNLSQVLNFIFFYYSFVDTTEYIWDILLSWVFVFAASSFRNTMTVTEWGTKPNKTIQ